MLQEIEKDHPDLLKFGDEFQGVTELASRSKKLRTSFLYKNNDLGFFLCSIVDTNELQRIINEIKSRVTGAQTDIDNAKSATGDSIAGDRFANAMEVIRIEKKAHFLIFGYLLGFC